MTPKNFCYWLQGFFELLRADGAAVTQLTPKQIEMVEQHLQLVFEKARQLGQSQVTTQVSPLRC